MNLLAHLISHLLTAFVPARRDQGNAQVHMLCVTGVCMMDEKDDRKQTQKEGYKYAHIQRQTDRQRNNRIMGSCMNSGAKAWLP